MEPAELTVDVGAVGFGSVTIDSRSDPVTLTIVNVGDLELLLSIVQVNGDDAGAFVIIDEDCLGTTLGPDESCQVTIVFAPTGGGPASAVLLVEGNPSVTIQLSGTGVLGQVVSPPDPSTTTTTPTTTTTTPEIEALPFTGSDPFLLGLVASVIVLMGIVLLRFGGREDRSG